MESSKYNYVTELTEDRSVPYYNQWYWSLSWRQPEIAVLRDCLDLDRVNHLFERRRYWEKTRWDQYGAMTSVLRPSYRSAITPEVQHNVHQVREWLVAREGLYKTVFYNGQINIYTNDRELVDQGIALCEPFAYGRIRVKQALITLSSDTVVFKRPYDYTQRTYIKTAKLTTHTIDAIKQWASGMGTLIKFSPSFGEFLMGQRRTSWYDPSWTFDYYFVDHNDSKLTMWLNLLAPGLVRKTVTLQSPTK